VFCAYFFCVCCAALCYAVCGFEVETPLTCVTCLADRNENKSSSSTGRARNGGDGCHYYTLGVDALSSERQIKVAYRKLALKFHPDKNKEVGAEEQFKTITSAYSVLIDKTSRNEYDRTRKGLRHAW
jgi:DnaJ-class molecular chaperone